MADKSIDRNFWRDLRRQIARRTRNQSNAEDLLHSAYLRMIRYKASHEVADPGAFLVKTACNIGIDNYRHDKMTTDESEASGAKDISPLQDEVIASRARLIRVREGLEQLTPRTREIFLMNRLDNMKYHEIAQKCGISASAVEKHIAKALLFLNKWTDGW